MPVMKVLFPWLQAYSSKPQFVMLRLGRGKPHFSTATWLPARQGQWRALAGDGKAGGQRIDFLSRLFPACFLLLCNAFHLGISSIIP